MSVDLQRQITNAVAFFLAGERCSLYLKIEGYGLHDISAPAITNYALSVELALKTIHSIIFEKATKGHSLEGLFNELPDDIKSNLPHLRECGSDIDQYFVDWRYPYEKEFLVGDISGPRRSFIECHREIRRLMPDLVSNYEKEWGKFEPDWINAMTGPRNWEVTELLQS